MKNKIIFFLFLCIQLFACQEPAVVDTSPDKDKYVFKIEYPGLTDDVNGEVVKTRVTSLPSTIKGYLFAGGQCAAILSGEELDYNSGTGNIRFTMEGAEVRTLYIVASSGSSADIPGVTIGMTEENFLQSKTTATNLLTGKVTLNPDESTLDRTIRLESVYAEIKLSRSSTFNIERVEIRNASRQSYYFAQTPFAADTDTLSYTYTSADIPTGNLEILLPVIQESGNVEVTVYGSVYNTKVSLDFPLQEVKRNNQYELKVESPGIDARNRKFMVMAVCGESNAVGFDESPRDLTGEEAPVAHLYQLGMRTSKDRDYRNNLKVIPMDFCPQDMYDMRSRFGGTKKPHFPLGKELLKRIPEGYEVLFIDVTRPSSCITVEGCRAQFNGQFATAAHNNGLGFYDSEHMLPANMNAIYYWNEQGAFYKMLVDRVKYALSLNAENKFLGVMWIQGEDDQNPSWVQKHHSEFDKLTTAFFKDINDAGYGERCPRGTAGKHIWYNVSTVSYWVRFHLDALVNWKTWGYGTGQGVFGYYKLWNPDTFVRPPSPIEYTNATNGTGATAEVPPSHYGNGAYAKVVCPMLAECMDRNGGLFNGKTPQNDSYVNRIDNAELQAKAGNINDDDVQDGLLLALPLNTPGNVINNLARNKSGVDIINNGLEVSASAFSLPSPEAGTRTANTLKMTRTNGKNIKVTFTGKDVSSGWSATCMIRRTAHQGQSQQRIWSSGMTARGPYMAFLMSYKKEKCGEYTEFLASPAMVDRRDVTLPGSLHNADKVRSYDEWIHYGVIYDATTKNMRIFMNGEEVENYTFDSSNLVAPVLTSPFFLGSQDSNNLAMEGEISEFFFWNKPITDRVMDKIYVRSYWGYEKQSSNN